MAARGSSSSLLKLALKNKAESGSPRKASLERAGCREDSPPSDAKKLKKAAGEGVTVQRCLCSPTQHPGSFRCRLHRAARPGPASTAGRLAVAMPVAGKVVGSSTPLPSPMKHSGGGLSPTRRRERDASPRARRILVGILASIDACAQWGRAHLLSVQWLICLLQGRPCLDCSMLQRPA